MCQSIILRKFKIVNNIDLLLIERITRELKININH